MSVRSLFVSAQLVFKEQQFELATLLLIAAVFLGLLLWTGSLDNYDEAFYGQIAHEMAENSQWLTTHWNYRRIIDKPPLSSWAMAVSIPSELAVRLLAERREKLDVAFRVDNGTTRQHGPIEIHKLHSPL